MLPTNVLHILLFLESVILFVAVRQLKQTGEEALSLGCNLQSNPPQPLTQDLQNNEDIDLPMIYVVTPTYTRPTQLADLTRLSNTLRLVPRVHWLVSEDSNYTSGNVADLLDQSALSHTQLAAARPENLIGKVIGRGVFNRRAAISWIRENAEDDGVVYFADDDNSYDTRIFEEIRKTKSVSVFPVGLILKFGVSSPIVVQGRVVGFFDAFQAGRKFAMDMAGFAVSVRHLRSRPEATFPARASWLEEGFVQSLEIEIEDLEPRAEDCTRVWVWHTRTEKASFPNLDNVKESMREDTNLYQLHKNLERR